MIEKWPAKVDDDDVDDDDDDDDDDDGDDDGNDNGDDDSNSDNRIHHDRQIKQNCQFNWMSSFPGFTIISNHGSVTIAVLNS